MIRLGLRTAAVVALLGVVAGVAAGSASASNTTGVTCRQVSSGATFSDAHCRNAPTGAAGFIHESLTQGTSTPITIASTSATTVKNGANVGISCTTAAGTGTLNTEGPSGPEMYSSGTAEITLSGCSLVSPPGFGCKLGSSTLTLNPLIFTTKEQGMGVNFAPKSGTTITEAKISECTGAASIFNGARALEGHVVLRPHGATLESTHAGTTMSPPTLTFAGTTAGLTSSLTMTSTAGAGAGSAIAFT